MLAYHRVGRICKVRCAKVYTIKDKGQRIDRLCCRDKLKWEETVRSKICYYTSKSSLSCTDKAYQDMVDTGIPTPIKWMTLTSFVNNLAPKCNPNPRISASTNPRTNPNCKIFKNLEVKSSSLLRIRERLLIKQPTYL